jgi:hypothetical protein
VAERRQRRHPGGRLRLALNGRLVQKTRALRRQCGRPVARQQPLPELRLAAKVACAGATRQGIDGLVILPRRVMLCSECQFGLRGYNVALMPR